MKITLHIWRQKNADAPGRMVRYELDDVSPEMSFLEMLDVLNEELMTKGYPIVIFDPHGDYSGLHVARLKAGVKIFVDCAVKDG